MDEGVSMKLGWYKITLKNFEQWSAYLSFHCHLEERTRNSMNSLATKS